MRTERHSLRTTAVAAFVHFIAWMIATEDAPSLHAADIFLDLGTGIPGESTDPTYGGKVEVISWSWGLVNSGTAHLPGNLGMGVSSFKNLTLTKCTDKASAPLMLACAQGRHLNRIQLILRKRSVVGSDSVHLVMTLSNVLVSAVSANLGDPNSPPVETVSFDFSRLFLTYSDAASDTYSFGWEVNRAEGGSFPNFQGATPVSDLTTVLSYVNGARFAELSWISTPGARYQVWSSDAIDSGFVRYRTPTSDSAHTSLLLPADAIRKFFRVDYLPTP